MEHYATSILLSTALIKLVRSIFFRGQRNIEEEVYLESNNFAYFGLQSKTKSFFWLVIDQLFETRNLVYKMSSHFLLSSYRFFGGGRHRF